MATPPGADPGCASVPEGGDPVALAAQVAGWDLTGEPVVSHPLDDGEWPAFLDLMTRQRLTGFLLEAERAGAFAMSRRQRDDLRVVHSCVVRRVLLLEQTLVEVTGELGQRGIDHRVLKGAALAHTIYPDPTLRLYGDIDVLVPSARLDDAIAMLTDAGARRVRAEPRPGFLRRYGKSVMLILRDDVCIDLHRALAPGPWAVLMDPDALFTTKLEIPVALGSATIQGLGPVERFVHACYHATVGSRELQLVAIRDVVQTALAPGFDEHAAIERARAWSAVAVVAAATLLAWDLLRPSVRPHLVEWAAGYRPDRRDDRRFRHVDGPKGAVEMIRAIPGMRAKAAYVGALAFPSSEYLAERGQSQLGRLARGAELARRLR